MEKSPKVSFEELVSSGLARVHEEHGFLVGTLVSVLEELGDKEAALILRDGHFGDHEQVLTTSQVQAVSFYFQLLNLAEEHVSNSIRRDREMQFGPDAEPGHWGNYLRRLKDSGYSESEVRKELGDLSIEPVFTKHPTEAKRWAVLGLHREIVRILKFREEAGTPFEEGQCAQQLQAVLERLWLTGEIFAQKPEVKDELENLSYYLKEIFPVVFNRLDERLRYAWKSCWPESNPLSEGDLPKLAFGSWVGGDRDGHPKVTAEVTRETLSYLRAHALDVVNGHLFTLSRKLSFNPLNVDPPKEMMDRLTEWKVEETGPASWESYVLALADKLEMGPEFLRGELLALKGWLEGIGAHRIIEVDVSPLIRLIDAFGFHLARLDIRQNSDYYEKALTQMMVAAGIPDADSYADWPVAKKLTFLGSELTHSRPLTHPSMDLPTEAREVHATFKEVADHRDRYGIDGIGALIISMTRNVADLLTVYVLGKEVGLTHFVEGRLVCDFPVVPLFETYDDLEAAPAIIDSLLGHPCARTSLRTSPGGQPVMMIMLGYSDSNKDTGIIASQWALQKAQQELVNVGKKHGISITFFHGRGGTVGRGAGPTHRFLEALPRNSLDGGLRITEQGEVIGQKFNTPTSAVANLEWLIAGSLGGKLLAQKAEDIPEMASIMDFLAVASRSKYRDLLEMQEFMSFYRQATPIDAIELSRIGSRPSRRTGQATLNDLRAIPWVFSWNQARFYLPGWYGVGTALKELSSAHPELYEALRSEVQTSPFLRYVLYNTESSLASSDRRWMQAYAGLVEEDSVRESVFGKIVEEHDCTEKQLQRILSGSLPERRPRFYETLQAREAPLTLLHNQQITLLKKFRTGEGDQAQLTESLLLVINAIASGLRTTG